jgi:RNA polymerase sigma-70 factor (ECF subfamily)
MSDFERIAREHRPRLVRLARRVLDRSIADAAEDVAQIALLKAWRSYSTFQGGNLAAWLDEITRNAAADYRKSSGRKKRRPEGGFSGIDVEDISLHGYGDPHGQNGVKRGEMVARSYKDETDHARDIVRACARVSDKQSAALELHATGHTFPEIGRALDCSADAARDRVARARTTIQEFLK